ncbi:hypothetical protein GGR56DRAFT_672555 [Xylariaceae sp. FL0804]|nr:hypothetical protein GGR56DRAFT_672555 [Xylariaceae sp. FL0804]
MEFRYSDLVDPALYHTDGLSHFVPLRMHKDPDNTGARAALRAQDDWSRSVQPLRGYQGGLADRFGFIRVTYGFIYDDEIEKLDPEELRGGGTANGAAAEKTTTMLPELLQTFSGEGVLSSSSSEVDDDPGRFSPPGAGAGAGAAARIKAGILAGGDDAHRHGARRDVHAGVGRLRAGSRRPRCAGRKKVAPYETLDEFLPARIMDTGESIWHGILTFAMAPTIPAAELAACVQAAGFSTPGYAVLALTKDLYSWRKEEKRDATAVTVFSSIPVIMRERGGVGRAGRAGRSALPSSRGKHMASFREAVEEEAKSRRKEVEETKLSRDVLAGLPRRRPG